jgi:hypothetical protein
VPEIGEKFTAVPAAMSSSSTFVVNFLPVFMLLAQTISSSASPTGVGIQETKHREVEGSSLCLLGPVGLLLLELEDRLETT